MQVRDLEHARAARRALLDTLRRQARKDERRRLEAITQRAARATRRTVKISPPPVPSDPTPVVRLAARPEPTTPPAHSGSSLVVSSTAYALPGTTATGLPVGQGMCAVDPSVIPLGTRFDVPGYGSCLAADTGSAIVGDRIDVWVPSEAAAVSWGRRDVTITFP